MFCRTNILIQVENDQNAQKRKRNADSIPKYQAKAHLHIKSGPSTKVGGAQVHPGTDHAKAVVSQPHLGAGTLGVRPYPYCCHLGLASTD